MHRRVLVYPTSAALVLLAAASNDTTGPNSEASVNGIRELTHYLRDMLSRKGCDLEKALPWFSRFEAVAAAISAGDTAHEIREVHKVSASAQRTICCRTGLITDTNRVSLNSSLPTSIAYGLLRAFLAGWPLMMLSVSRNCQRFFKSAGRRKTSLDPSSPIR